MDVELSIAAIKIHSPFLITPDNSLGPDFLVDLYWGEKYEGGYLKFQ
jgi:hypothetical protein